MDEFIGPLEKEAIHSFFSEWMKKVSQDISKMVNKTVSIAGGTWKVVTTQSIKEEFPAPQLSAGLEIEGLPPHYILMHAKTAAVLVDLFMGGDASGVSQEFNDIQRGILEEIFTQISQSLASRLSEVTGKPQKSLPPKIQTNASGILASQGVMITYDFKLNETLTSSLGLLVGTQLVMDLGLILAPSSKERAAVSNSQGVESGNRDVVAKQARFNQLSSQPPTQKVGNIDLILDVLLQLTAVLGRTGITIKDLVQLGPGSVLELDKLAGEAVELYANNKLVAKGEVVVIDERFAVRVTETVSPMERLQNLKS